MAATGIIKRLYQPSQNPAIRSRPDALALFNPVVLAAPVANDEELTRIGGRIAGLDKFKGVDAQSISPWHHVGRNAPPTISSTVRRIPQFPL